jgi:CHAT domain-containing protein
MSVYQFNSPRFAIFYGKKSVNLYQQQRSQLLGSDTDAQKDYLNSVQKTYRSLAELLISEGRISEAQQVLNALKDQQFFDFDRTKSRQPEPLTLSPLEEEYSREFDQILTSMSAINREITQLRIKLGNRSEKEDAPQLEKFNAELEKASHQLSMLLSQAEAEFSKSLDNKDNVDVTDTRELQQALHDINRQTGQKTVAVYTLLGQDKFHAAIISADGISSISSVANRDELNKKALQLWAVLQSADYDPTTLSNELYKLIFKPIEARLPRNVDTIIWSLDENLRYLPMAALYDGKQYLVERYQHVLFTRADKERITRTVSSSWTGYFFATSMSHTVTLFGKRIEFAPLHFIKDEMQIFRTKSHPNGVIDGDVLAETQFTRASLLAKLKVRRPLVHISSHFRFRPGDATNSFLLFGDDQVMTLAEMKEPSGVSQKRPYVVTSKPANEK